MRLLGVVDHEETQATKLPTTSTQAFLKEQGKDRRGIILKYNGWGGFEKTSNTSLTSLDCAEEKTFNDDDDSVMADGLTRDDLPSTPVPTITSRSEEYKKVNGVISFNRHNIIAYSCQSNLFIFDPNEPSRVEKLESNHIYDVVRSMNWSMSTNVSALLTHDSYDMVTMWKSSDQCVNEYSLRKSFNNENVICSKWCDSLRIFTTQKSSVKEEDESSLEVKYSKKTRYIPGLATGIGRALITIASHGKVILTFFDHCKYRWVTTAIHLNLAPLRFADFTILKDGQLCIACCEANSSTIHVFYCSVESTRYVESKIPYSLVLVSHYNIVLEDLIESLTFISLMDRLLIKTRDNKFHIFSQEHRQIPISSVIPITDLEKQNLMSDIWVRENFNLTFNSVCVKTSIDGQYLVMADKKGAITIFYFNEENSQYEQYDEISNVFSESQVVNKTPNYDGINAYTRKKRKIDNEEVSSRDVEILDVALSPNSTILAVLDSNFQIRLLSLKTESVETYAKKLEVSMLNFFDKWDILASITLGLSEDQIVSLVEDLEKRKHSLGKSDIAYWTTGYDSIFLFINS